MSNREIEVLKSAIITNRSGSRQAFPDELKAKLVIYFRRQREAGASIEKLSEELGLCSKTVYVWLRKEAEPTDRLRQVRVVKEKATAASSSHTMHGPAGTRVEGLSVEEIASLWGRLSC
jgi:hypothetical protein